MSNPKSPSKSQFTLEIHEPFSTFTNGEPTPIPYIIDGLLPEAAFSVLGGKAKHGKSSMSRIEVVAIAKGIPFLGRATRQAEVLLCSLEDPKQHVDNCLRVLDYNPAQDARIHLVHKLPREVEETVAILTDLLAKMPQVKFVVLDTLAKVLRAKDSGNYDEMLSLCEQLHTLARESGVHVQALTHCKKVQPDDPFDGFLGSVEVRAEPDTNIVLFDSRGKRFIQSETRMGIPWDATEIHAEMATIEKSQMVKAFYLGDTQAKMIEEQAVAHEANALTTIKLSIISALKAHNGEWEMTPCIDSIPGAKAMKYEARDELIKEKVIKQSGVPRSKANPLKLTLLRSDWSPSGIIVAPAAAPQSEPIAKSEDDGKSLDELKSDLARAREYAEQYPSNPHWQKRIPGLEHTIAARKTGGAIQ